MPLECRIGERCLWLPSISITLVHTSIELYTTVNRTKLPIQFHVTRNKASFRSILQLTSKLYIVIVLEKWCSVSSNACAVTHFFIRSFFFVLFAISHRERLIFPCISFHLLQDCRSDRCVLLVSYELVFMMMQHAHKLCKYFCHVCQCGRLCYYLVMDFAFLRSFRPP